MPSVHNPKNLNIASNDFTDVVSIEFNENQDEIIGPASDGEIYHTVAGFGASIVRGKIIFRNPVQAKAACSLSGTLTAVLSAIGGGSDKTLIIDNVKTSGAANSVTHGETAMSEVRFLGTSSDGSTSPVSIR